MEKTLSRTQAIARQIAGLDMDDITIVPETPSTRPGNLGIRLLREAHAAGVIDTFEFQERIAAGQFPGSFDETTRKLREAALQQSALVRSDEFSVEVIAVYPDHAFLFDSKNGKYFEVRYELDSNDEPRIISLKTIAAPEMVREHAEVLHKTLRENLIDSRAGAVPRITQIADHLVQFEKQLLVE